MSDPPLPTAQTRQIVPVTEAGTGILNRVVAWLRRGYPSGVPEHDYIALLALQRRRLTDDPFREHP